MNSDGTRLDLIPKHSIPCAICRETKIVVVYNDMLQTYYHHKSEIGEFETFRNIAETTFDMSDYWLECFSKFEVIPHPPIRDDQCYGLFKGHYTGLAICNPPLHSGQQICSKCTVDLQLSGNVVHIWSH